MADDEDADMGKIGDLADQIVEWLKAQQPNGLGPQLIAVGIAVAKILVATESMCGPATQARARDLLLNTLDVSLARYQEAILQTKALH